MKNWLKFWLMAVVTLPSLGCANLEVRHTADRRKIIFEKPIRFTYDLDLEKKISDEVRLRLGIPVNIPYPEIVLMPYAKAGGAEANFLGVQYNVLLDGAPDKRVIEIYYRSIQEIAYGQSAFETAINNVICHETLHAYYPQRYLTEHTGLRTENKANEIGDFDHCKMIETGDLEYCTGIVNRWLDNNDVTQQQKSLARAKWACEKRK